MSYVYEMPFLEIREFLPTLSMPLSQDFFSVSICSTYA